MVVGWECLSAGEIPKLTGTVALDVECVSPDTSRPDLAKNPHRAVLAEVFLYAPETSDAPLVVQPEALPRLTGALEGVDLVGMNFRYDLIVLRRNGLDLTGYIWNDIMHWDHIVDENNPHSLASIVSRIFKIEYKDDFWSKYSSYLDAPEDVRRQYGANDVYYTYHAYIKLKNRYAKASGARSQAIRESLKHGA